MNNVKDLQSEVVQNNATSKLPLNMMTKCLTCVRPNENYHIGLEAFCSWLREVAAVQKDNLMSGHHNPDKAKWANKGEAKGSPISTSATNTTKDNQKHQRECILKDGNHPTGIAKSSKNERRRNRTNGQRTETVLQNFVRRTSDERLLWQTLRRHWLRKTSSQIATPTIQKSETSEMLKMSRRSPTCLEEKQ